MEGDFRSFGTRLLMLANVLAASAAAVLCVVAWIVPDAIGQPDPDSGALRLRLRDNAAFEVAAAFGATLLVLNVLHLLYGRRPKRPLHHVSSEAPGGVVRVSREALESGLRSAGESLEEVTRLRVAVEHGGLKKVLVKAWFQSPEGVSLLEASRRLRGALTERFKEMVRLMDGARVDYEIEFVGFAGRMARKPQAAEPPPAKEEPSAFTGPKYPIDDEDPFEERQR